MGVASPEEAPTKMIVMPAKQAAQKWLRRSMLAYLQGEKELSWVSGVVRGSETQAALLLLTAFREYSATTRYLELQNYLRDEESAP
jgi:hypothetical protein